MARAGRNLYYITHVENVPSIVELGILSHQRVVDERVQFVPIYDTQIVASRGSRVTPDGRTLWQFANLYFQPRNAMLFRVTRERQVGDVAIVAVRPDILNRPDILISIGNAASPLSDILPGRDGLKAIAHIKDILEMVYWKEEDGSKRLIMAECLVPNDVPPQYIQAIYVASHDSAEKLRKALTSPGNPVIPEPNMFFEPSRKFQLTQLLSVVDGDLFFSRMQTLTVSVNCVGVMGKGLASRAKYQFPDVYVLYQDLCRKRVLQLGKPYLYRRESSSDHQLADEPATLSNANSATWFLLFATKQHWRQRADVHAIEKGLQWVCQNYKAEGIQSLAVPALGCGLGWLEWRDVGPLLCSYLSTLSIPVSVYLPAERTVPDELLSREFLLGKTT